MSSSLSFEKVAECLYRNPSSTKYYGLIKVKGKQHKRSLKTTDLAEAKRKLRDYRVELEGTSPKAGKVTVGEFVENTYKPFKTNRRQPDKTRRSCSARRNYAGQTLKPVI
jgi:hypothetical protein